MSVRTTRRGIRWAKVSGTRGKWTVATGWRGDWKAADVQTISTRLHADVIAAGWLNDAPAVELEMGRKRDAEERAEDAYTRKLIGAEAFAALPRRPRYKTT